MPRILVRTEANFKGRERLKYVLQFLRQHPVAPEGVRFLLPEDGVGETECEILYQSESPEFLSERAFQMPYEQQFFATAPEISLLIKPVRAQHNNRTIHGIQLRQGQNFQVENDYCFLFDVFETLFFHLSRWEEWNCGAAQLDEHGRFRAEETFVVKHNLWHVPVADHIVWYFYDRLGLSPKIPATTFCRTHDLDILEKFPSFWKFVKAAASLVFYQKNLPGLRRLVQQFLQSNQGGAPDPYDTFEWLLKTGDTSEKILYVMAGGQRNSLEGHFSLNNSNLLRTLKSAKNRGYQIGIHPSYDAAFDGKIFESEKRNLEAVAGQPIQHSRQHFLRWRFPDTPRIIETAGIRYDSTLGFSDRIGFRCGTGFDFQLYDFERERPFDFIERPLAVMDVALLREAGMDWFASGANPGVVAKAEHLLVQFLYENAYLTKVTFNLHNSTFDSVYLDAEELKALFDRLF